MTDILSFQPFFHVCSFLPFITFNSRIKTNRRHNKLLFFLNKHPSFIFSFVLCSLFPQFLELFGDAGNTGGVSHQLPKTSVWGLCQNQQLTKLRKSPGQCSVCTVAYLLRLDSADASGTRTSSKRMSELQQERERLHGAQGDLLLWSVHSMLHLFAHLCALVGGGHELSAGGHQLWEQMGAPPLLTCTFVLNLSFV